MPINTIQCKQCGNRIHYSVDNFDTEQTLVCNRCGTDNYADVNSLSKHVAEEIELMQEEFKQEAEFRAATFKPSFEDEDGMPKSKWRPGASFMSDESDDDLDEKLDSVREKFKKARSELSDVGMTFEPSSAEELINRFTAEDIDLTVNIPLDENNRSESPSYIKRKALELMARKYLGGDISQANDLYLFITNLYTACREQKLNFKSIAADGNTVIDFAERSSINPKTVQVLRELYQSGDIDNILNILDKHLQ